MRKKVCVVLAGVMCFFVLAAWTFAAGAGAPANGRSVRASDSGEESGTEDRVAAYLVVGGSATAFQSLDEAFDAALEAGSSSDSPAVIELGQDCTRTAAFAVTQGRHVVLDLKGYVLTCTAGNLFEIGANASFVMQNGYFNGKRVDGTVQSGGSAYLTGLYFPEDFEVGSLQAYVDVDRQTMVDLSSSSGPDHYGDPAYRADFPLGLYESGGSRSWSVTAGENIFSDGEPIAAGEDFFWNMTLPEEMVTYSYRIIGEESEEEAPYADGLPSEAGNYYIQAVIPSHVDRDDAGTKKLYSGTTCYFDISIKKAVASIAAEEGEILFASLAEALAHAAAWTDAEAPAVIFLAEDHEVPGQIEAAEGDVVLDLNGFVLRLAGTADALTVAEGAVLTITGGYLDGPEGAGVQNEGTLSLAGTYLSETVWSEALAGALAGGETAVELSEENHYGDPDYRAAFPHAVYATGSLSVSGAEDVVFDGEPVAEGEDFFWSAILPAGTAVSYTYGGGREGLPSAAGDHEVTALVPECLSVDGENKIFYPESEVRFTLTIARAVPACTPPEGLTAVAGQTLGEVALPEGWSWQDGSIVLGAAGEQTVAAVYTPADPDNYATVTAEVIVTVSAAGLPVWAIVLIVLAGVAVLAGGGVLLRRKLKGG